MPAQHSKNYTICGTPFKNWIEFVSLIIIIIIIVAFTNFNKSFKILKKNKKTINDNIKSLFNTKEIRKYIQIGNIIHSLHHYFRIIN